ncbi:unnamed protein product [Gongylonema pulchrum]|uniref:Uncharacterized protein n=1 Tax=Gongylonema pulchrum TaxID=637853 RepID=A0A183ERM6_9BILA|nr:unnamed protein product [Gongylonema pulchrum]
MASSSDDASTLPHSSSASKLLKTSAAERRKKVFLGELPDDFLRITVPATAIPQHPEQQHQQQHQQQQQQQQQQPVIPVYIADPVLAAQQSVLQAQVLLPLFRYSF